MPFGNRVRSAKIKGGENRFVANKDDIHFVGKLTKTINHLSPDDEASNKEHDKIIAHLFGKNSN